MAKEWYLLSSSAPQLNNSGFETQEFVDYAVDGFDEILEESFLGQDVITYFGNGLDEKTARCIKAVVQNNSTDSQNQDYMRQILAPFGSLKLGMYVKFQNRIWLIVKYPGNNQIYEKGIMFKCNYPLRWYNSDTDRVIERWVYRQDSTRFSSGVTSGNEIAIGNARDELIMPKDDETVKIHRDQRFIIDDYDSAQISDPLVFKVTKENKILGVDGDHSLFSFIIAEGSSFNPVIDNRELMIADYYNKVPKYELDIVTLPNIEINLNSSLQIQVIAKKNDVEVDEDVVYMSLNTDIAEVSDGGEVSGLSLGETTIKVSFHSIEKFISVKVVDNISLFQDFCVITFSGEPIVRIGGSFKTFNSEFYDKNGKTVSDIAVWNVFEHGSNKSPDYIHIEKQGNSVRLSCENKKGLEGQIIELVLTGSSGLARDVLEIELVGFL